jgi:hypothetical protein
MAMINAVMTTSSSSRPGSAPDEAEEIVAGMAAAVGSQREKLGQDSVTNPPGVTDYVSSPLY